MDSETRTGLALLAWMAWVILMVELAESLGWIK